MFDCFLNVSYFAASVKFNAQVPAKDTLGETTGRCLSQPSRFRKRRVQDIYFPRNCVHRGHRLPKPIGKCLLKKYKYICIYIYKFLMCKKNILRLSKDIRALITLG